MKLRVVSTYILSERGGDALRRITRMDSQARGVILERAARAVSFQPRYVVADVLGTPADDADAELPPMDTNGKADPYVSVRIVSPDGVAYPEGGVCTRTAYRTLRPQWRQRIEVPIRGGVIEADGIYRTGNGVTSSELSFTVYDADLGTWGWLRVWAECAAVALGIAALFGHVSGATDGLESAHKRAATAVATGVAALFLVAHVMHDRWRSDDQLIGEARVPLSLAMDQDEHTLLLRLRSAATAWGDDAPSKSAPRNPAGLLGAIRVRIHCSEQ